MLHEPAAQRIEHSTFNGPKVVDLLRVMAEESERDGLDSAHVAISFIEVTDVFVPGTYVPEIHLILRKVDG